MPNGAAPTGLKAGWEDVTRDEGGRWTSGGGGGAPATSSSSLAHPLVEYTVTESGIPAVSHTEGGIGAALVDYTGIAYGAINNKARHGDLSDTRIAAIDRAFTDAPPLAHETTLYRGVDAGALGLDPEKMTGAVVKDDGFVSTSTDLRIAKDFASIHRDLYKPAVYLEIHVPQGAKALDVAGLSGQHEDEVLLPRGGTFRIGKGSREEYPPTDAERAAGRSAAYIKYRVQYSPAKQHVTYHRPRKHGKS